MSKHEHDFELASFDKGSSFGGHTWEVPSSVWVCVCGAIKYVKHGYAEQELDEVSNG